MVSEREQVSDGFKRTPLDWGGGVRQLHFQKDDSMLELAPLGGKLPRPSHRQQPVRLESRDHAKVVAFLVCGRFK